MVSPSNDPTETQKARHSEALTGLVFVAMLRDADQLLERHIDALNAINVFPVPDGDTGTNMHLTMQAAVEALGTLDGSSLADVAAKAAHGALMGARGNSGVILSQILRGFSLGLVGKAVATEADLASALASGADAAYAALAEPREGTILTVARAAADGARADESDALSAAAKAAHEAVARTPDQLPVLKEAGVVDAGGLGLAIVLEAFARSRRGESLDVDLSPELPNVTDWRREAVSLHHAEHGEAGYCTEFVVSGSNLDPEAIRKDLTSRGSSLLVVGDAGLLHVHIHTSDPDSLLGYGRDLGSVSAVKVENMDEQASAFASGTQPPLAVAGIDVVAVAAGEGIKEAFRSIGVQHIVEGGQTMNPSAGDILAAIDDSPNDQVVVLPNNKNIIAAAEQAAAQTSKHAVVLPSRTIPQGIAAVLALSPDTSLDENVAAMKQALATVRSAEVTRAVRETVLEGRSIAVGQAIGIIDGDLDVIADSVPEAVEQCIVKMKPEGDSLLTLYVGSDVKHEDADQLAGHLRETFPGLEIEIVSGGQPHYLYWISLE